MKCWRRDQSADPAEELPPRGVPMKLVGNWNYPTSVRFGAGRIAELGAAVKAAGMSRPLLVTDPRLAEPADGQARARRAARRRHRRRRCSPT